MNGDVMGGGVVVAIAAALWLAYLVPVWLRRREYLATERNAVRLQQTLRILAETSELPDEVRMEATARTVAEQQRILRRSEQKTLAAARAEAAAHARREQAIAEERRRAAEEAEQAAAAAIAQERAARAAAAQRARVLATASARPVLSPQRRRRLRRARALSTFLLVAGLIGLVAGTAMLFQTGAWMLAFASAGAVVVSGWMLGRLARPQRALSTGAPMVRTSVVAPELYDDAQHDLPVQERLRQSWTPRPLPKPLHLSPGTVAAAAMASVDAAAELRRAAARAEFERKAAEAAEVAAAAEAVPAPVPLRPVAVVPAPAVVPVGAAAEASHEAAGPAVPSQYANMGILDETATGSLDLDAVLRRRRAAS
ncbi:hypothetical protein [Leifsonia sp. fls2-241-R2A-40a]|uniref:hypothetical protein n=1 Tax=Leifsonia sp. fls2-241-R2A-40a TaxID=3040290 RepID=UPI00254BF1C6|nr:hypothetical protein [Leifsonia sp. fls2-241-R2A-40a]